MGGGKVIQFRARGAQTPAAENPQAFAAFKSAVETGNSARASAILQALLGVEAAEANRCMTFYSRALNEKPELPHRLLRLRMALTSSLSNDALVLLCECFGLTISEATIIYGNLLRTFA